jgi:hypothetical protein
MSPAIRPLWDERTLPDPESLMPLNDNISILAILGSGEPVDITRELAETPLLMDLVVVLAQGVAAMDLVRLAAGCHPMPKTVVHELKSR